MRTTNKQFTALIKEHIIERLSEEQTEVLSEQLQNVVNEFHNWYSLYEQKRTPNKQAALVEWLLGLPMCFNLEVRYHEIHLIMKSWFEAVGDTYKEPKHDIDEANTYYHLVTRELFKLIEKEGITL